MKDPKEQRRPALGWRILQIFLNIVGRIVLYVLVLISSLLIIGVIAGLIFMVSFSNYLKNDVIPSAEEYAEALELNQSDLEQTSIIYYLDPQTGEEKELQRLYATQNRIWVSYNDIPQDMVNAAIAIEDKRFPTHNGVDWLRTLSAVGNFASGDTSYGASTITQQLIKNLSMENDVTIHRKVQEIFRALAVEERYTKEEIMEWYLNTIYLGEGCYGVQSAAQVYFGKEVSDLTAAECACLIGITNNPSLYDPYWREERNRERQLTILSEMHDQGYLSDREYREAVAQPMVFHNGLYDEETYLCSQCGFEGVMDDYNEVDGIYFCPSCETANYAIDDSKYYSYFVDTVYRDVLSDLADKFGISNQAAAQKLLTGGYRIYATVNPEAQNLVDRVFEDLNNIPKTVSTQQLQAAVILIDNATGDIVAMSGGVGKKPGDLTLNRATQSKLPVGSSIKPIAVYAPAVEAGLITPATVIEDSSIYEDSDWPQNYYRNYSGPCTVLRAVANSLNTVSVKTLDMLGLENSYQFMTQNLGFTTLVESLEVGGKTYTDMAYAPLGLGELTYGLTVREMAQAYACFPNNGVFREARSYTKVVDAEGNIVLDNTQESHTAFSETTAYYMNYMLSYAVSFGTGSSANFGGMDVAGKTGTSGNDQCRWFAGYTPYYTAVLWCGYDQPEEIIVSDGTNPATNLWKRIMQPLHEDLEKATFQPPEKVGYYTICSDCGLLATEACEKEVRGNRTTKVRLFYADAPVESCKCHKLFKVCHESKLPANEYCELVEGNTVEEISYLIYNKDWLAIEPDDEFVYDESKKPEVCTIHDKHSVEPSTEESTEDNEPTEPIEPEE